MKKSVSVMEEITEDSQRRKHHRAIWLAGALSFAFLLWLIQWDVWPRSKCEVSSLARGWFVLVQDWPKSLTYDGLVGSLTLWTILCLLATVALFLVVENVVSCVPGLRKGRPQRKHRFREDLTI